MNTKYIIIALFLSASGFVLYTNHAINKNNLQQFSPEQTTYQDQYGYLITYPKTWIGEVIDPKVYLSGDALSVFTITPEKINEPYIQGQVLTIAVYNKSLDAVEQEIISGKNIRINNLSEVRPVTLDGAQGFERPYNGEETFYYLETNGKLYAIHLHLDQSLTTTLEQIQTILSTLRFN